jgi:hypothetical protein
MHSFQISMHDNAYVFSILISEIFSFTFFICHLEVEYLFWYFGVLLSFVGSDFFLAIMLTA